MVAHPRELSEDPRESLELRAEPHRPRRLSPVPPLPPRRLGRPVAAIVLFLVVATGVASPVLRSASERAVPLAWQFRPPPASDVKSIPPIAPVGPNLRPRSGDPVGGMLFVRCTKLWASEADGTHARPILHLPGISSPALSSDARTVAFMLTVADGQDLWLAGADGSDPRPVGRVADGGLRVTGLQWAPSGDELAFALVRPTDDRTTGGSVIWTLDLLSGRFTRVGLGLPSPFYVGRSLAYPALDDSRLDFAVTSREKMSSQLSSPGRDLSGGLEPRGLESRYEQSFVAVRDDSGDIELVLHPNHLRNRVRQIEVPITHRVAPDARPVMSSGGRMVAVDLVDFTGQRDVGLYDRETETWTIVDYAWEPAPSPSPPAIGALEARYAVNLADRLLWEWESAGRAALVLGHPPERLVPGEHMDHALTSPRRTGSGWAMDGIVWGRQDARRSWRRIKVVTREVRGRIAAEVSTRSRLRPIETVDDAARMLSAGLGYKVATPAYLPESVALGRWPAYVSTYGRGRWGEMSFDVGSGGPRRTGGYLRIGFGSVYFMGGCGGGSGDPRPVTVAGQPALFDRVGSTRQVIWPATSGHENSARYSVFASEGLPRTEILAIAESMAK